MPGLDVVQFEQIARPKKEGYQSNPEALEHMGHLIAAPVSGGAGVGKDTLISEITNLDSTQVDLMFGEGHIYVAKVVADTTRPQKTRNGRQEQHGVDYWFRTYEEALHDIEQRNLVQWDIFETGELYGTRSDAYPADGIAAIDVMVTQAPVMRALPFGAVHTSYIVAESLDAQLGRLHARGEMSEEEFKARLLENEKSLALALDDPDQQFIVNEQLDKASTDLLRVMVTGEYDYVRQRQARNVGHSVLRDLRSRIAA